VQITSEKTELYRVANAVVVQRTRELAPSLPDAMIQDAAQQTLNSTLRKAVEFHARYAPQERPLEDILAPFSERQDRKISRAAKQLLASARKKAQKEEARHFASRMKRHREYLVQYFLIIKLSKTLAEQIVDEYILNKKADIKRAAE